MNKALRYPKHCSTGKTRDQKTRT